MSWKFAGYFDLYFVHIIYQKNIIYQKHFSMNIFHIRGTSKTLLNFYLRSHYYLLLRRYINKQFQYD